MKRSSDDNDTITAAESRERFIGAVKSRRINPNANRDVDMTIEAALANAFIAIEGTHELFVQIGVDYSWVDDDAFVDALAALEISVPDGQHECIVSAPIDPHVVGDQHVVDAMIGSIDVCVDTSTAYELKFVRELTYEHELQALLYAAIPAISNETAASVRVLPMLAPVNPSEKASSQIRLGCCSDRPPRRGSPELPPPPPKGDAVHSCANVAGEIANVAKKRSVV